MNLSLRDIVYVILCSGTDFINCLLAYAIIFQFEIKKNIKLWVTSCVCVLTFHVVVAAVSGVRTSAAITILTCFILLLTLIESKGTEKYLIYPFVYFGTSTFGVCVSFLLGIVMNVSSQTVLGNRRMVLFCQCVPAVLTFLLWLWRKITKKAIVRVYIGIRQYVLYYVGIVCVFIILSVMQYLSNGEVNERVIMICGFALSLVCILFLLLLLWQGIAIQNQIMLREQNQSYEIYLKNQEEHFRQILLQDEKMRRFRHDMKAHMIALQGLSKQGDLLKITQYLDGMAASSSLNNVKKYTQNVAVDAVLNEMINETAEENITVTIEGFLPLETRISDFELCTLFYNLLKNAYEACDLIEERDRVIDIKVSSFNEKIYLFIKNPVLHTVEIVDGKLSTSKSNRYEHGFGSRNVEEIVNKYSGYISYRCEEGFFTAELMI